MELVRTLVPRVFNMDGTRGTTCGEATIPAGLICKVLGPASTGSYYITPVEEDWQHYWTAMKSEHLESVSEMDVLAQASAGKLSPEELLSEEA